MTTELFKDGDRMAITTNEPTEIDFTEAFSKLLECLIEDNRYEHDWQFQFNRWLPQYVDICNMYRFHSEHVKMDGYKIAAGRIDERPDLIAFYDHSDGSCTFLPDRV